MPSAAGIIMATGVMTIANDALQNDAPLTTVVDRINWKVIPATAVAAGIFYAIEQINGPFGRGLAWVAFVTAFMGGESYFGIGQTKLSPMGTLLKVFNAPIKNPGIHTPQNVYGYPYA
jgi:hypothetical protein